MDSITPKQMNVLIMIIKEVLMQQEIIFSPSRGTYNLIVDGEWYAEGTYEQMEQMYENNRDCELERLDGSCED